MAILIIDGMARAKTGNKKKELFKEIKSYSMRGL